MINWDKTKEIFGYSSGDRIPKQQKIICQCDICGLEKLTTKHYHYRSIKRSGEFRCQKCGHELSKNKISESIKNKWEDKEYRQKQINKSHTEEFKKKAKEKALELWQDDEYKNKYLNGFDPKVARKNLSIAREKSKLISSNRLKDLWSNNNYKSRMQKQSKHNWNNDYYRDTISNKLKNHYGDPEILERLSAQAKKLWQNEEYRKNIINKIKERKRKKKNMLK